MNPSATAIIPCHPRNRLALRRTLESVEAAAKGIDVETIVVDDPDSRGPSWARNEGLRRAKGDVVFFVDADDTVRERFFSRHLEVLDASGADFVLSSFDYAPLKREYNLVGNAAIREAMLPAFFGYSFDDVRRWNAGGDLQALREQGSVWRCAFRRDFLERYAIRFDENLTFYEDSAFVAECVCRAERVASVPDVLYDYEPGVGGNLLTALGGERYWPYKFAALANRKAIAARVGGDVMRHFEASAVFSALELFKARRGFLRYARDSFVADAFSRFPTSFRHLLTMAAVQTCGFLAKCARSRAGSEE